MPIDNIQQIEYITPTESNSGKTETQVAKVERMGKMGNLMPTLKRYETRSVYSALEFYRALGRKYIEDNLDNIKRNRCDNFDSFDYHLDIHTIIYSLYVDYFELLHITRRAVEVLETDDLLPCNKGFGFVSLFLTSDSWREIEPVFDLQNELIISLKRLYNKDIKLYFERVDDLNKAFQLGALERIKAETMKPDNAFELKDGNILSPEDIENIDKQIDKLSVRYEENVKDGVLELELLNNARFFLTVRTAGNSSEHKDPLGF